MESRTGQSQDITPGRGGGVLLTDITTVRAGSWGAQQAGPAPAHLSLPFWMEGWPRLALSKSGEFLLRFVLVERTLFCGEQRAGSCYGKGQSTCSPSAFHHQRRVGKKGLCFDFGQLGLLQ